jgi:hypothetical protein
MRKANTIDCKKDLNMLSIVLLCLCFFGQECFGIEKGSKDDIAALDLLISATEKSLQRQKALKVLLVQYKQAEQEAIKNSDDAKSVAKLIACGKEVYSAIKTAYLEDYFSPQFIEELKTLADIGDKKQIPSPK